MQILERLIRLSRPDMIPIPLTHRIPLGLLHGTAVQIGVTTGSDRLGDIVVSALDLKQYEEGAIFRVTVRHKDEAGLIEKAVGALGDLRMNIALAEAVTIEEKDIHEITLICEHPRDSSYRRKQEEIVANLKKHDFQHGPGNENYVDVVPLRKLAALHKIINPDVKVDQGWLKGVDYLSAIREQNDYAALESDYELDFESQRGVLVVVSADTERRLIRYKFPKRHARTLVVRHRDQPGALKLLFHQLNEKGHEINVLSSYLRRGGEDQGWAKLIAICEPAFRPNYDAEVSERFDKILDNIKNQAQSTYHFNPQFLEAEPDYHLIRMSEPLSSCPPILLLREFLAKGADSDRIVKLLRKTLINAGCIPVESVMVEGTFGMRGAILAIVEESDQNLSSSELLKVSYRLGELGKSSNPIFLMGSENVLASLKEVIGFSFTNITPFLLSKNELSKDKFESTLQQALNLWGVNINARPAEV